MKGTRIGLGIGVLCTAVVAGPELQAGEDDLFDWVEHHSAENDGVKLHYVTLGDGPLVVLLHGFPDWWYTWRHQMGILADNYRVAALDLRGYNKSDQPEGVESYAMRHLIGDVAAVIQDCGEKKAIVIGHDWGAAIAWQTAMNRPDLVERLVIMSVPHPSGFGRELATNEAQREGSDYARRFQEEDAHEQLSAEGLAGWVEAGARQAYVEAFRRSSFEGMLAYYKANFPRTGTADGAVAGRASGQWARIACPVLIIHGLQDQALHAAGHSGSWEWIDGPTSLLMIPDAGHFVQHDARELVTKTLVDWLKQ